MSLVGKMSSVQFPKAFMIIFFLILLLFSTPPSVCLVCLSVSWRMEAEDSGKKGRRLPPHCISVSQAWLSLLHLLSRLDSELGELLCCWAEAGEGRKPASCIEIPQCKVFPGESEGPELESLGLHEGMHLSLLSCLQAGK